MRPYYEDDAVTLYHGDCREVLPTLGPVDLVLTDPPYAISLAGVTHKGRPGKGSRSFDFFDGDDDWSAAVGVCVGAVTQAAELLTAAGSIYCWVGHRQFGPLVAHLEVAGWKTRFLAWVKKCPAPPPPGAGWPSAAELCVYASRPGRTWNHDGSNPPPSNVFVADSFRYGQPGKVDHPTQKPSQVITPLIAASAPEGGIVLDPFAGSGTTLRAAKDLGRRAIGIEIEERYCEIAAKRMAQEVLF